MLQQCSVHSKKKKKTPHVGTNLSNFFTNYTDHYPGEQNPNIIANHFITSVIHFFLFAYCQNDAMDCIPDTVMQCKLFCAFQHDTITVAYSVFDYYCKCTCDWNLNVCIKTQNLWLIQNRKSKLKQCSAVQSKSLLN